MTDEKKEELAAATAMTTMMLKDAPASAVATAAAAAAAMEATTTTGGHVDAAASIAAEVTAAAAANGPPPMQIHPTASGMGSSSNGIPGTVYHIWPSWPMVATGVPMPDSSGPPHMAMRKTHTASATAAPGQMSSPARPRGGQGKLKWESYFNLLVDYKNEHDDLNIPRNYTVTTTRDATTDAAEGGGEGGDGGTDGGKASTTIDIDLGKWACTQRVLYKRKLRGHKYTITDDRIARLTNIGFPWEVTTSKTRKLPWQYYYNLLLAYQREHGHLNIPHNYISTTQGDERSIKL
jgi:Helicase associated domain